MGASLISKANTVKTPEYCRSHGKPDRQILAIASSRLAIRLCLVFWELSNRERFWYQYQASLKGQHIYRSHDESNRQDLAITSNTLAMRFSEVFSKMSKIGDT